LTGPVVELGDPTAEANRPGLELPGCQTFTINPRSADSSSYWPEIERSIEFAARWRATGLLCFTGLDCLVDPWITAAKVASSVGAAGPLVPLVAVNPNNMPPFALARMLVSIERVYGVLPAINWVTGASGRERYVMHDEIDHDLRYDRLVEYATIVIALLGETRPVTFSGRYYQIRQATLALHDRPRAVPISYLAGHSDKAADAAARIGATQIAMLESHDSPGCGAIHFGLCARETREIAWDAARRAYPESDEGKVIFEVTMKGNDSIWKRHLAGAPSLVETPFGDIWREPFHRYQCDCPIVVGSHAQAASLIDRLLAAGVHTIVLDLPPDDEAYRGAAAACAIVRDRRGIVEAMRS
jgi:alkanesulfonate monooxygenase